MSDPEIIPTKDFISWIMSQDDNRPVNMKKSKCSHDAVGCAMIEFQKDRETAPSEVYQAGFVGMVIKGDGLIFRLEQSILKIIPECITSNPQTFGELKKLLAK